MAARKKPRRPSQAYLSRFNPLATNKLSFVKGMSASEHEYYARSLAASNDARRESIPLSHAAKRHEIDVRTVKKYMDGAIDKANGRLIVKNTDNLVRPMTVITTEGVQTLYVRGNKQASLASRHYSLSIGYAGGKNISRHKNARKIGPEDFRQFSGKTIAGEQLETNPDKIRLAVLDNRLDMDDLYPLFGHGDSS